jgi:hypothetical protein
MAGVEMKSWDSPDETRTPDKTKVEVVGLGATTALDTHFSQAGNGPSASSPR